MSIEEEIIAIVKQSLGEAIRERMKSSYGSPVADLVASIFKEDAGGIRSLVEETFEEVSADKEFREEMKRCMRHRIAREITNAFGEGMFKKHIVLIKSDHMLKAKCILAVERILEQSE